MKRYNNNIQTLMIIIHNDYEVYILILPIQ